MSYRGPVARSEGSSVGRDGFIDRFGLWEPDQYPLAALVQDRIASEGIRVVRFCFVDQHGIVRAKALSSHLVSHAFRDGIDFPVAPLFFDTANAIVFDPFVAGGGFGLEEMSGDPDAVLVADPATFVILPWSRDTGWVLCDMYFGTGEPVPFSSRFVLDRALKRCRESGFDYVAGLEVEWHLMSLRAGQGSDPGGPGAPGAAPEAVAVTGGFQYLLEDNLDQLDEVVRVLFSTFDALGLPLRSVEDEWGPGQVEVTFDPLVGMAAADAMVLARAAIKQVCRRLGLHATFMCKPAVPGSYASGWHLHQSLVDRTTGLNAFISSDVRFPLSAVGASFVGGLLAHAPAACLLTTPTINGYRRLRPFSLGPATASWGIDNRAAMVRVQGAPGEAGSHIENRIGEPAANPYLYLAAQIHTGLHGVEAAIDPGPASTEPYHATHLQRLPAGLDEAVDAAKADVHLRERIGEHVVDYLVRMAESHLERFRASHGEGEHASAVTDWEQREYFQLF